MRPVLAALAVALLLVAAPLAILASFYPPPHAPTHSGAWMGTPALLNFSLAAAVLRLLDFPDSTTLPHNWQFGNDMLELRLETADVLVSLLISGAVLLVGICAFALRYWRLGKLARDPAVRTAEPAAANQAASNSSAAWPLRQCALATLLPLALATLPLSWSHYQLLELPGAALFLVLALRDRSYWGGAAVAAFFLAAYQLPVALLRLYIEQLGWTAASPWSLWAITAISPVSAAVLFVVYLKLTKWAALRTGNTVER
jgi:hypothetical protein